MGAPQAIGLGVLGVAVGALGTLIGAGGGFVLLPILVFLYPGDPPAILTAISLSVVLANATSGSIAYARLGRVDVRSGLLFAAAGLPGAIVGALLTRRLEHRIFDPLLGAVLLLGSGIILLRPRAERHAVAGAPTRTFTDRTGTTYAYSPRLTLGALTSIGVGFVSSLLGIGGGIIHVPVMVYFLGFPTHVSTATSHFVLALLTLAAVIVHAGAGTLAPGLSRTVPLAVGAVAGAQAGAWLSTRLRGRWILWGLAAALASVGVRLLLRR
jgi:hypothetical protein